MTVCVVMVRCRSIGNMVVKNAEDRSLIGMEVVVIVVMVVRTVGWCAAWCCDAGRMWPVVRMWMCGDDCGKNTSGDVGR